MTDLRLVLIAVVSLASACSHKHAPTTAVASRPTPVPTPEAAKPAEAAPQVAASPHLAVSDDIGTRCKLHFGDVRQAPKFSFDEFALSSDDRSVLDQVATCMTRGPLKGRSIRLVGRTDPRGTDEYNLGLGDRRARIVDDYLTRSGVAADRLSSTTRGKLDSRGQDEAGWQVDRRVDLELN